MHYWFIYENNHNDFIKNAKYLATLLNSSFIIRFPLTNEPQCDTCFILHVPKESTTKSVQTVTIIMNCRRKQMLRSATLRTVFIIVATIELSFRKHKVIHYLKLQPHHSYKLRLYQEVHANQPSLNSSHLSNNKSYYITGKLILH